MPDIPYTCTGHEKPGDANIYENGVHINTLNASRCFAEWYCATFGYTWDWRDGIDPDDPETWPAADAESPPA